MTQTLSQAPDLLLNSVSGISTQSPSSTQQEIYSSPIPQNLLVFLLSFPSSTQSPKPESWCHLDASLLLSSTPKASRFHLLNISWIILVLIPLLPQPWAPSELLHCTAAPRGLRSRPALFTKGPALIRASWNWRKRRSNHFQPGLTHLRAEAS